MTSTKSVAGNIELSPEFGARAVQKKYDLLSAVHGSLDNIEISDRTLFTEMMYNVFVIAQLSDRDLADDTGHAITSVRRWINGKTAPHHSIWGNIRNWCLNKLANEMSDLQKLLATSQHDNETKSATG